MKHSGSKKRKLLLLLFLFLLIPLLLGVLAVQPFFIRAVILPQVEKATDSQIEIGSLAFSPFSKVAVKDVLFQKNDQSLEAEISSATISYDLIKILKGTIYIEELLLIEPTINYRMTEVASAEHKPVDKNSSDNNPPKDFHIKNVSIQKGAFRFVQGPQTLQLTDVNFALPSFVTGELLSPSLSASLAGTTIEDSKSSKWNGTLNADFQIRLSKELYPTSFKGHAIAKLVSSDSVIPEQLTVELKTDVEMALKDQYYSIRELSAVARQADKDLFRLEVKQPTEINLSGPRPTFTDTEISLKIPKLTIQDLPFSTFFPTLTGTLDAESLVKITQSGKSATATMKVGLEEVLFYTSSIEDKIQANYLSSNVSLNWTEGQSSKLRVAIDAKDIILPGNKKVPSPLHLKLDADTFPTRGELTDLTLSWSETPEFKNQLRVKGFADWTDLKALKADLTVRASKLDLEPWSAFLVQESEINPQPAKAPKKDSASKIDLSSWPIDSIKADMEIDGIKLEEILLESIKLKMTAGSEHVIIQPASFIVNDSRFTTDLDLSWEEGPLVFKTSSSLSPLDLEPIYNTVFPAKKGAVTGVVQGQTSFNTQGQSIKELWDALDGSVDFAYTDGKLRLIDSDPNQNRGLFHTRKLVQDLITALANSLKLSPDQLMAPDIEAVLFQARLKNQLLSLNKVKLLNPELLMEANGAIRLSSQIEQSRIENLPVVMGLNTNLAKRVKIYRENRVQNDYVVLPSFIAASGTLAEPEIEVKESMIAGLILSGVTERNKIGNENVQTALDVLGSVLTGEPVPVKSTATAQPAIPGSTPSPTPEPSKADQIVEGLRFIQKLRATPTPAP